MVNHPESEHEPEILQCKTAAPMRPKVLGSIAPSNTKLEVFPHFSLQEFELPLLSGQTPHIKTDLSSLEAQSAGSCTTPHVLLFVSLLCKNHRHAPLQDLTATGRHLSCRCLSLCALTCLCYSMCALRTW